jgi:hypothetical protein
MLNGLVAEMPQPGPFRIDSLAPGSYRLSLTGGKFAKPVRTFPDYIGAEAVARGTLPNAVVADYEFEITDRDIDDFKIALAPYASVIGDIRMLEKDAKIPEKLAFAMMPAWDGPILVSGSIVQAGKFRQDALRPGEYWPQFARLPDGYAVAQILFDGATPRKSTVTLNAPDTAITVVITSRPGAIAGTVRTDDQSPAAGVSVVLLPDPLPEKPARETIHEMKTGDDGAFVFKNLAAGNYKALVFKPSELSDEGDTHRLAERAARVSATEVLAGQTVTLNLKL